MKKIILASIVLLLTFNCWSGISIVSDLDDTIKITNSGQEIEATINGLFSDKVFSGMPEFLAATKNYTNETYVLTASPFMLKPLIQNVFKKRNIEVDEIILKRSLVRQSNLDYKVEELKKIFEKNSDDFILIGDDVGNDPEAYETIKGLYPNRVLAIYIHAIQGRSLPKGSFQYWTVFDLLVKEHTAGRMLKNDVEAGAELLLEEKKLDLVFPDFAKCPKTPEPWLWQLKTPFTRLAFTLAGKFTLYCLSRSSGIN